MAKVLDFGLVRDLERAAEASRTNVVQGTPLYLSPEAITAPDRVDGRADLYALGAVGYFLLTGQHVFSGATLVEVCSHHLHTRPVPPSERLGHALPAPLEALVLACLVEGPWPAPRERRRAPQPSWRPGRGAPLERGRRARLVGALAGTARSRRGAERGFLGNTGRLALRPLRLTHGG